ncbi:MAG: hypothetical protein H7A50_08510 [Akkermansiaceae bacterium]|nr:hypothetical protein [Akkermansiaceae bacterium]
MIVTLSLMVLLALLAVGLLSLSAISLRASSHGSAMAEARANARLGLMLALNDLQVQAGPDTRITAPAGTLGEKVPQPNLTGVWNSRRLDPEQPDDSDDLTDDAKADDFRGWLVSGGNFKDTREQDYGTKEPPSDETARTLLSSRYSANGSSEVVVGSVPLRNTAASGSNANGRLAYAVFDEGTKARLNLGVTPGGDDLASRGETLASGQTPELDRIDGLHSLPDEKVDLTTENGSSLVSKLISLNNSGFGLENTSAEIDSHFNDITPYSLGLLTDVSKGGLKKDLNLLAEASPDLPGEYAPGAGIYQTEFGIDIPSDPLWSEAMAFANLFNERNSRGKRYFSIGAGGVPTVLASAPKDWSASIGERNKIALPNPEPPTSPVLLPSIAKVQMVYSLHVHDLWYFTEGITPNASTFHNGPFNKEWKSKPENQWDKTNWSVKNQDREINYQMWVFCTPIITLHNPYNVALEIPSGDLTIDFVNVPFGMQFFVNGQAQTSEMVPYTRMFYWNDKGNERRYTLTLYNKRDSGRTITVDERTPLRLLPGEVKVFSPYMNPDVRYVDRGKENEWYNVFNEHTANIRAIPGWMGEGIGYGQDQPLPDSGINKGKYNPIKLQVDGNGHVVGNGRMMQDGMALTGDEEIFVKFAPVPDPDQPEKRFTIEMTLNRANRDANARSVVLDFDYEITDGLQSRVLGTDGAIRWPSDGSILATELRDHWSSPLKDFQKIKPVALLSAYAKTTHGGVDESNDDGRYPAKPWVFNNHAGAVLSQKVVTQHPAHHSHEINLVRLPGHTEEAIDIQPGTDRGSFVTGHTVYNGRRFGTMLDVPLGPVQSPVSLNGANLAAGFHLPRFTAPIGNSFAHPAMPSSAVISSVHEMTYADHCYLLNSVFFDSFYCSGMQTRGGSFADGRKVTELAEGFFSGDGLLPDPRLVPHFADGATPDEAATVAASDQGFENIAAYQLVNGAFNVNSTSVDAWKAVLSSLNGRGAAVSRIPLEGGLAEKIQQLDEAADDKGARFSRFRLPNFQPDSNDPDALWHASRDLTRQELERLAEEIVKQVRERGPFLSMSEFVNRQIGPSSQNTVVGALQAAIDNAGINACEDLGGYDIQPAQLPGLDLLTPKALEGPSAQGAPGVLSQCDLLSALGNCPTVRSDTFVVRSYGESLDSGGKIRARAWCEAVVQRVPEYVDPVDAATTAPAELGEVNSRFGRRFNLVAFRWLNPGEV